MLTTKEEILVYKGIYPDHYDEYFKPILARLENNYLSVIENEFPIKINIEQKQSKEKPIVHCIGGSISSSGQDRCDCECNDVALHKEIHSLADEVKMMITDAGVNHCSSHCIGKSVASIYLNLEKETMILNYEVRCCCHVYENFVKELIQKMNHISFTDVEVDLGSDYYKTIVDALY